MWTSYPIINKNIGQLSMSHHVAALWKRNHLQIYYYCLIDQVSVSLWRKIYSRWFSHACWSRVPFRYNDID